METEFEQVSIRLPKHIIEEIKECVNKKQTPYDKNFSSFMRSAAVLLLRVERKVSHLEGDKYFDARSKKMRMDAL